MENKIKVDSQLLSTSITIISVYKSTKQNFQFVNTKEVQFNLKLSAMASPIQSHQGILDGNLKQEEEEESFPYAMQLVNSCALPMALQSTIELGVFDILAKAGPRAKLSPSQIVAQMPTKNPEATVMLDRILRMLASHSVLGCSVVADEFGSYQRLYSLSPVSKHFVRNEDGVSLGPLMALLQDKVFLDSWYVVVFFTFLFTLLIIAQLIMIIKVHEKIGPS